MKNLIPREIIDYTDAQMAPIVAICAKLEAELQELDDEERELFKTEYSMEETALRNIIDTCLRMLGLVTFFTTKGRETKAWLIKEKTTAVEAAGNIHTDMQKGFISVDVIGHDSLIEAGSLSAARENGLLRSEGKNYHVRDGDVLYFRFSS